MIIKPPINTYRHYSFDLWMTLIKSNPAFKIQRAKFFHQHFNARKKSLDEIISIFRQVDIMCNAINEKTGKNIDADEMHLMVISLLNDFDTSFAGVDLVWLYNEMETMLFNYMPVVYCDQTINSLTKIRQKNNSSFNIASNTAFIKGKTLRTVLSHLKLTPLFDFQLYSDEIGISKPHKQFFDLIVDGVKSLSANKNISIEEIVHIGDSLKADVGGALFAGINSVQINSNNATILSLLS